MNKFLEQIGKFENLWLKIPFLLYGMGFLIHNIYLTKYSFFDFEIIQTKYIYTGISAIVFFIIILLFIVLRLDFDTGSNNIKLKNLLTWVIRLPILTIIINVFLGGQKSFIGGWLLEILGKNVSLIVSNILISFSIFYLIGLIFVSFGALWKKDYKLINPIKIGINILSIPVFIIVFLSTYTNKDLSSIFAFLSILFVWTFSFLAGFSDAQKGIRFISSPIKGEESKFTVQLNKLILNIYFSLFLLSAIYIYSINIHPIVSINLGGTKPVNIEIDLKDSSIKGLMIIESPKWLLIQESDSTIVRIKVDDIIKIKSSYKKK